MQDRQERRGLNNYSSFLRDLRERKILQFGSLDGLCSLREAIQRAPLVILKSPHPRGPVLGLHAPGLGPRPGRIEVGAPGQGPEFLESDLTYGPVQEQTVDTPLVPVEAVRHAQSTAWGP